MSFVVGWVCLPMPLVALERTSGSDVSDEIGMDFLLTGQNEQITLPLANAPAPGGNTLGYRVTVTLPSNRGTASQRLEATFESLTGPTTRQFELTINLIPLPGGHVLPDSAVQSRVRLAVPEGATSFQSVHHLPKLSFGNHYRVVLQEDGRTPPACRGIVGQPFPETRNTDDAYLGVESRFRVVAVGSPRDDWLIDDVESLAVLAQVLVSTRLESPAERLLQDGRIPECGLELQCAPEQSFPTDWRSLGSASVVLVPSFVWNQWRAESDLRYEALLNWMMSGGMVVVRQADGGPLERDDERPLGAWPLSLESRTNTDHWADALEAMISYQKDVVARGRLNLPTYSGLQEELRTLESLARIAQAMPGGQTRGFQSQLTEQLDASKSIDPEKEIVLKPVGPGILFQAMSEAGIGMTAVHWWLVRDLGALRARRLVREGVEPVLGSRRFDQWLLTGVAQPPVYTFMGLLTVFVIVVGPIAYRKTARSGRVYLMFLLAPLMALVTTGLLLVYGVVADGFGTQARVRQITWLDRKHRQAVTRSRSTYFAGIRPFGGLKFAATDQVTVFPDNESRSWESRRDDGFVVRGVATVDEDGLNLSDGFLPSRRQRQFVTMHVHHEWPERETKPSENGPSQIRNPTPWVIRDVIFRNGQGQYFTVERCDVDCVSDGVAITAREASKQLGELYKREWLVSSVVNNQSNNNSFFRRRTRGETLDVLSELLATIDSVAKPAEGLFEHELQLRMQLNARLPLNSFIALAEVTPDAIAVDGAEIRESIHFVMGDR
ncbi:MAG: hypothetical protein AAGD07_15110 [Planctomycetota bacterium]